MANRILVFLSSILGKFPAVFGGDFLFESKFSFLEESGLVVSSYFSLNI